MLLTVVGHKEGPLNRLTKRPGFTRIVPFCSPCPSILPSLTFCTWVELKWCFSPQKKCGGGGGGAMPQACTAQGQAAAQEPISKGTRDSLGGGGGLLATCRLCF